MLKLRIISGIFMILLLALVLWAGGLVLVGASVLLAVIMTFEYFGFALKLEPLQVLPFPVVTLSGVVGGLLYGASGLFAGVVLAFVLSCLWLIVLIEREGDFSEGDFNFREVAPAVLMGVCYPGIFGALLVYCASLPDASLRFLWLFSVTILSDTLAYFGGSTIGGPKLAPRISPKKTLSGAFCGLMGALGGSFVSMAWAGSQAGWQSLLLYGVIAGILVQTGDLVESLFKRIYGVKDSSRIIPGHGGVLDRVDGILFGLVLLPFIPLH